MTVIEVEDLRKNYGNTRAVDGVSFTVARGETFGVLGHNGAGKTTTVECLVGLRKPDSGTIRVLGENPARRRRALAQRTGVQLQQGELPDRLRVAEAMRLFAAFYDRPDDWRAAQEALANVARHARAGRAALTLSYMDEEVTLDVLDDGTGFDPAAAGGGYGLIAMRERASRSGGTVTVESAPGG
ncbi:ATP-binding cassette domain-containing protein, partial [Streptosporangium roseum]|uniref:ATP-binding cassette domain-containing protein n=1 Tax=Streptosporangium roseum TaxID=2001 RepID=UPI0004CD88DE